MSIATDLGTFGSSSGTLSVKLVAGDDGTSGRLTFFADKPGDCRVKGVWVVLDLPGWRELRGVLDGIRAKWDVALSVPGSTRKTAVGQFGSSLGRIDLTLIVEGSGTVSLHCYALDPREPRHVGVPVDISRPHFDAMRSAIEQIQESQLIDPPRRLSPNQFAFLLGILSIGGALLLAAWALSL